MAIIQLYGQKDTNCGIILTCLKDLVKKVLVKH